ncbi:hypothetical protein RHSIM_Rhsim11G0000200 [Rhododendron simsii]|uniref:MSP domain-containing protein n=1 Tax=Rhododendron simsii TaxID=118357 RepID=A0A834G5S6_RHOSS|nr:hypothetical protein RHSIM_Rhsim11G0000200 [Rhododendron simsii]
MMELTEIVGLIDNPEREREKTRPWLSVTLLTVVSVLGPGDFSCWWWSPEVEGEAGGGRRKWRVRLVGVAGGGVDVAGGRPPHSLSPVMQRRCENNLVGRQCLSYGRQTVQPQRISVELEKQSYCDLRVVNNTEHCVAFKVKTTSPKKYFVRPNTGVIQPWDSCFIRVATSVLRYSSSRAGLSLKLGGSISLSPFMEVPGSILAGGLQLISVIHRRLEEHRVASLQFARLQSAGLQDMLTYAKVSKRSVHVTLLSRARVQVTLQAQREYPPDMQSKDKFLLQSTIVASHSEVDELQQDTFTKDIGKVVEECKLRVVYLSPQAALGNSEDEASKDSKRNLDSNSVSSTIALLFKLG